MSYVMRARFLRYGLAFAAVALVTLLKMLLDPLTGKDIPFLLFLAAAMISARYGGLWPGLLAVILSAVVTNVFLLLPDHESTSNSFLGKPYVQLGFWLVEMLVVVWISDSQRVVKRGAYDLERAKAEMMGREQSAHAAAYAAEQRYRELVNGLDAIVWEADPKTLQMTFVSQRAERILGYPLANWFSQLDFWLGLVHPDDREHVRQMWSGNISRGENLDLEFRACASDGSILWLRELAFVVRNAAGQVSHLRGLMLDNTERKQAQETSAKFAALVESSEDAIIGNDLDGTIISWNEGAKRVFGFSAEEMIGKPLYILASPQRTNEMPEILEAVRRGERIKQYETMRVRKDGQPIHVSISVSPIKDSTGKVIGASKIARDITERNRLEEYLRQRADDLAEAARRKDEFLAILSHELRNPLAPIRNALHIMQQCDLGDPVLVEAREVMERQIQQLARIVDDLLDVFRIRHNKISLRKEWIDVTQLVSVAIEDHRTGLERAGLILNFESSEGPLWVRGDRIRLSQVLSNLLQNAAKFCCSGDQVFVRVSAESEHQEAAISIRDTGIGIAPEVLPHMFETFSQAHQGLDRTRGGLGLGLALVKGLVELHGGRVQASSAGLGHGTEIKIGLPLGKGPKITVDGHPTVVPSARHLRVLIVEDNRDAARTLGLLLNRCGHEVAMAHSGRAGVETARDWQPDVVLCDLGLPEMDGYEVASTLRCDPATSSSRLIAVSGYGQDEDRQRSEEAGFDLHLTKPVDPAELQRLLSVIKVGH